LPIKHEATHPYSRLLYMALKEPIGLVIRPAMRPNLFRKHLYAVRDASSDPALKDLQIAAGKDGKTLVITKISRVGMATLRTRQFWGRKRAA
jgi:hypothetical protein